MSADIEYQPLDSVLHEVERDAAFEERRRQRAGRRRTDHARARQRSRLSRGGRALSVLLPLLAVLLALNASGLGPFQVRPRVVTGAAAERAVRSAALFGARRVEAYRRGNGQLPRDLATLDLDRGEGWEYSLLGAARYQIGIVHRDLYAVYDSGPEAVTVSRAGEKPEATS